MGIKSVLRARKFMATKPVGFITGVLTLFIMANAYSLDQRLNMNDRIPPGNPHYSEKGFTLKPSDHGYCMYGVYNPASCTSGYRTKSCYVMLHYAASFSHSCLFKLSIQDFNIINNDTGKVVATFQWYMKSGEPSIRNIRDSEKIMANATGYKSLDWVKNKLNIYSYKLKLGRGQAGQETANH
ncbi:hypothetical protein [Candidatus Sororendozoicomonas aggregata]|uniref:hypothetical protein n=1 Tax=Candidatus Sororendozoicomonas aggregata TaxID=3073239 RepID=UPI002ED47BF2